jgi:arginine metabolism regulation protein II
MQGIVQLTFIDDKEDIRWLNAGNAARHRHSIFTGSFLIATSIG